MPHIHAHTYTLERSLWGVLHNPSCGEYATEFWIGKLAVKRVRFLGWRLCVWTTLGVGPKRDLPRITTSNWLYNGFPVLLYVKLTGPAAAAAAAAAQSTRWARWEMVVPLNERERERERGEMLGRNAMQRQQQQHPAMVSRLFPFLPFVLVVPSILKWETPPPHAHSALTAAVTIPMAANSRWYFGAWNEGQMSLVSPSRHRQHPQQNPMDSLKNFFPPISGTSVNVLMYHVPCPPKLLYCPRARSKWNVTLRTIYLYICYRVKAHGSIHSWRCRNSHYHKIIRVF